MMRRFVQVIMGLFVMVAVSRTDVFAGTDLSISCPNIGTCGICPSNTPLLDEASWYPGSTVTQRLRVTNTSGQTGFVGIEVTDYTEQKMLGEIVRLNIRRDSAVGSIIYGEVSVHEFRDDGYFTIDTLGSGQTRDYYVTAVMPTSAGNQYQAGQLLFDLKAGLEVTPIPPPSGAGDGTGSVQGASTTSTSTASPPVCRAQTPSSAPSLNIVSTGTNAITIGWTAVAPVTHYALIFTDNRTGAQYGSTNIGNTTQYAITNLSGTTSYTFEVFGVNDCAPGPRGSVTSGTILGPVLTTRPVGPGGQVLGVEDLASPSPSPSSSPTPAASPESNGAVAGVTTCIEWRYYLPLILLVAQLVLILAIEFTRRKQRSILKLLLVLIVTLLSIVLFYWLRECDCYTPSFWSWLCKWYWLVSLLLTLVLRVLGYAFFEDADDELEKSGTNQAK